MGIVLGCLGSVLLDCACCLACQTCGCLGNIVGSNKLSAGRQGIISSFVLVILTIVASIIFQNYVADRISLHSWEIGCKTGFEERCKGNSAVYRFSFALVLFFGVIQGAGTFFSAKYFDRGWGLKILVYIGILVGFFFVRATVFDDHGYAWFARIVGGIFLVLQQVILLDVAYTWNERWVEYSGGVGGQNWLIGLVVISVFLFAGSISLIGILYWQFGGCPATDAIISLTLCLCVCTTLFQLFFSDNASLITSAFITAYCTFLCYTSVSLNPDESCNPTIASSYQTLTEAIGVGFTVLSLLWTTYSAVTKLPQLISASKGYAEENGNSHALTGVIEQPTDNHEGNAPPSASPHDNNNDNDISYDNPELIKTFQHINLVFLMISCYYAMVLTDWATVQSNSKHSNSKDGDVAMWIIAGAQWLSLLLYFWSMLAPKLYPDRDFSSNI